MRAYLAAILHVHKDGSGSKNGASLVFARNEQEAKGKILETSQEEDFLLQNIRIEDVTEAILVWAKEQEK